MTKEQKIAVIKMAAKAEGVNSINQKLIDKIYNDKEIYIENTGIKENETDYFWDVRSFFIK
tara:strand:- start:134 stop:316 length:183 start_codon:yes stop_codon:yes gene_type:complete